MRHTYTFEASATCRAVVPSEHIPVRRSDYALEHCVYLCGIKMCATCGEWWSMEMECSASNGAVTRCSYRGDSNSDRHRGKQFIVGEKRKIPFSFPCPRLSSVPSVLISHAFSRPFASCTTITCLLFRRNKKCECVHECGAGKSHTILIYDTQQWQNEPTHTLLVKYVAKCKIFKDLVAVCRVPKCNLTTAKVKTRTAGSL